MNGMDLFNALSRLDDKHTERSLSTRRTGLSRKVKRGIAAACFVAAIALGTGIFAVAVEAKEYETALAYFEENGLPTEGLTRSEIKAVYRDITTETYALDKTAEVMGYNVPGTELEPTGSDSTEMRGTGITYKCRWSYVRDEEIGHDVFEKSVLSCYTDDELVWETEVRDFPAEYHVFTGNGTVIWGDSLEYSYDKEVEGLRSYSRAWAGFIDLEGKLVWTHKFDHGFESEQTKVVLANDDGTFAVFTKDNGHTMCFSRLSAEGDELIFRMTELDAKGYLNVWNAIRLGSEYLVQIGSTETNSMACLYRVDADGNVSENFTYKSKDCDYVITDMTEFCGRVYLSAYSYPKQSPAAYSPETGNMYKYAMERQSGEVHQEVNVTRAAQENYTALLLICDSTGKEPQTFYSVKYAIGGKLSVVDNTTLEWEADSITNAEYVIRNSCLFEITCKKILYSFNTDCDLTGQTDTGEISKNYR